jgi:hypothetical protein
MGESGIIQDRIRKKEAEIQTLEDRLRAAKIYLQALQDVLAAVERDVGPPLADALRTGSSVAQAREAILRAGKPVHVSDLLAALGKDVTKETRASLASSLAAYVRKGEVFTRPAPNTFGLVELGHATEPEQTEAEPPSDFGRPKARADEDTQIPF